MDKEETLTKSYWCKFCDNRFKRTFVVKKKKDAPLGYVIGQVKCIKCGNFMER